MKKMKFMWMLVAMAMVSFTFVIYIDLERMNDTNYAKAVTTRSVDAKTFGKGATQAPLKGTTSRLNSRR